MSSDFSHTNQRLRTTLSSQKRRKRKPEADMIIDRIDDQSETEEKMNDEKEISRHSEKVQKSNKHKTTKEKAKNIIK